MKTPILLLTLCLLAFSGRCQKNKVELSHYVFPEFVKGTVLMKSGVKNPTMLNYNALTEEMIFDTNGKKLSISKLEEIDTVYIQDRKFFPLKDKFVELIYRNKFELYAAHKCSVIDPGKPAAYGGTSQTSSVTSYSSIIAGGQAYQMKLPDGYTTKPYTDYWLKRDGKLNSFLSLRQLSRLFDDKSDLFKKYVKEHKTVYDKEENLVELIKYMEQQ
ncbi:MAG: hypothetical protein AAB347_06655 [Bacteroidota bacterium]